MEDFILLFIAPLLELLGHAYSLDERRITVGCITLVLFVAVAGGIAILCF
jgi:hypothetical protein